MNRGFVPHASRKCHTFVLWCEVTEIFRDDVLHKRDRNVGAERCI
jgi:hypothetical protein